jgi:hypothetical protein
MSNSITPPPELVQQWLEELYGGPVSVISPFDQRVLIAAAQWGADQELLACGNYLEKCASWEPEDVTELLNHRRPRPPSLKEQALGLLNEGPASDLLDDEVAVIRRALESLPD